MKKLLKSEVCETCEQYTDALLKSQNMPLGKKKKKKKDANVGLQIWIQMDTRLLVQLRILYE